MLQLLALLAAPALAHDPPAAPPATTPAPAPADCSKLTAEAKTQCDGAAALKVAQEALVALKACEGLVDDAKKTCDAQRVELTAKIVTLTAAAAPPADAKGGKATRSNTGRMEDESNNE